MQTGVMVLSGGQWLDQVLRPRLADVKRIRHDQASSTRLEDVLWRLGARLASQVDALAATGVLTEEQERAASALIEDAGIMSETRSVSVSASSSSAVAFAASSAAASVAPIPVGVPSGPPTLLKVSPGPLPLGRFDGRPVTLVSAELWSDRFSLDFYTETSVESRLARREAGREHGEWIRRASRGEVAERPRTAQRSPLRSLRWGLRDESGTAYVTGGSSGEWGDYVDRKRISWHPAPPRDIERVTLFATDGEGKEVFGAEISAPGTTATGESFGGKVTIRSHS
jgi:hypothetical protein